MALSPPTYVKDEQGATFIAASQRPDGTWRKQRRVRDGYVPQEEVPIYESKGRLFAKSKPKYPVGMSEEFVNAHKGKKENFEKSPFSGIMVEEPSEVAAKSTRKKKKKKKSDNTDEVSEGMEKMHLSPGKEVTQNNSPVKNTTQTNSCSKNPSQSAKTAKNSSQNSPTAKSEGEPSQQNDTSMKDPGKRLKNLRKRLREIEAIEEKISQGQDKQLEKDQLDKVARKQEVLSEIELLSKVVRSS
ncbi:partner of Y14 and mago [Schistocerca piceifrons]|uniref:partner of Y14 and mago n=1 Tax=Schistocerca piceifrons TaxID=274613 RepID=UPI001F5E5D5E|nr:partner of Y14 and mago [Schistocerca piceifrons]